MTNSGKMQTIIPNHAQTNSDKPNILYSIHPGNSSDTTGIDIICYLSILVKYPRDVDMQGRMI